MNPLLSPMVVQKWPVRSLWVSRINQQQVCTEFVVRMMGAEVFEFFSLGNAVSNSLVCLAQCCRARRVAADGDRFRA